MGLNESYADLRWRMIDQLRDPLLITVEREWSRTIKRENIVLTRAAYQRLKWDVVKAIVNGQA